MLIFLMLLQLALEVSLQETSKSATSPQDWLQNACTLIMCGPNEGGPRTEMAVQGLQQFSSPSELLANSAPNREKLGRETRELELLKLQVKELQIQMGILKATFINIQQGLQVKGQQGVPGKAGPSGPKGNTGAPGQKGQKGEMTAMDTVQRQVAALEKTVQTLQAQLSKNQKIFAMQGVTTVGAKTFVSTGQSENFANGKALCSQAGGSLAVAKNVAENTALAAIAKRLNKYLYLGMSDIQTEGKFTYLNGQPVTYTKWKSSEPNNLDEEDCVILLQDSQWNDLSCNHQALIVCEL